MAGARHLGQTQRQGLPFLGRGTQWHARPGTRSARRTRSDALVELAGPDAGWTRQGLVSATGLLACQHTAVLTGRTAHLPLEGEAECTFGAVAQLQCDGGNCIFRLQKPVACQLVSFQTSSLVYP